MKKAIFMTLSAFSIAAAAQDPYLNNSLVSTSDIFGTARFVGMGGAMGALGADISTISSNPAGIAMISKNEMSLTAGAAWLGNNSAKTWAKGTFAQFDQIGAVASFKMGGGINRLNFAFNYQKKANYDGSFFGEVYTAASWADQLDALAGEAYDNRSELYGNPNTYFSTIYGLADACGVFPWNRNDGSKTDIRKKSSDPNKTLQVTRGSLNAYEFNISMNLENRFLLGLTLGVDNVDYRRGTDYREQRTGVNGKIHNFGYMNEQVVTGNGVNLKFGAIIRPIDSSTFRLGFTVETPTWYDLKYIDDQSLSTKYRWDESKKEYIYDYESSPKVYHTHYVYDQSEAYVNYLEYSLTTPWKVRAQMGSTVGNNFAWGVEYEFANYPGTTMKFPAQYGGSNVDLDFKDQTKLILKPQHSVRAGIEFKPCSALALRAGYNFITSTTRDGAEWDPDFSNTTLAYPTGLDYMNLSDVHIVTFGLGFRHKWFYADLSYKYRYQRGEYYAFNTYWSKVYLQASGQNPNDAAMDPILANMDRHSIMATVGVRF